MDSKTEACEWGITGMDCASCAGKIRDAVSKLPGVSDVSVTVIGERLKLRLDPALTGRNKVEAVVTSLGYGLAGGGTAPARKEPMNAQIDAARLYGAPLSTECPAVTPMGTFMVRE